MAVSSPTFSALRARALLTLVAGIFLAASWVFAVIEIQVDRRERIAHGLSDLGNLADVLRQNTSEKFKVYEQGLNGIANSIEVDRLDDPEASNTIYRILSRRREATPDVIQFIITDSNGTVRFSSETPTPETEDLSWRPEQEKLRESPPNSFIVTPSFVGNYGAAKDKPIIVIARRIQDSSGQFAGAVQAAVLLDDLGAVAKTLSLGTDGSFGVVHIDGALMLRVPNQPSVQLPSGPATLLDSIRQNPEGGLAETRVDSGALFNIPQGIRYLAYRRVPNTPIVTYVAASQGQILEPWRAGAVLTIGQQILLSLLVVFLVVWVNRTLKRRTVAEAEHLQRLDCLAALTAEFMTYRDQQALLQRAADAIREMIPSHQSTISFYKPGQTIDASPQAISLSDKYEKWRDYKAKATGTGIYRVVMNTNKPMRLTQQELVQHPAWTNFGAEKKNHPPMRGWLAAPLVSQTGDNIGFAQLSDRVTGDYDGSDEAVLSQLAQVLSISLENLRLLAEAQDARDQLTKVFSATSDGVIVMDHDLRYLFANDAYCNMLGEPRENIVGRTIYERMPHGKHIHAKLEQCRDTRKRIVFDTTFVDYNGTKRWIENQIYPMDDKIVGSVRDVTDRQAAEQKLMAAQRMDAVGRLTGGLAHDFNNLLAVVMGNAEILLMSLKDQAHVRLAQLIRAAAARGGGVVNRLLAFARSQPLDPKAIDVADAMHDVEGLLKSSTPENVSLSVVHAAGLWEATADLAQLENVLVNLVMNARDALPEGGKITLEASNVSLDHTAAAEAEVLPGDYVLVTVTDTGTGMRPEVLAKAFEPFFTTKDVGKGTGLGLSMVYGFAQQSGGSVRIKSEPNHGTEVRLYLPRAQDGVAPIPVSTVLHYDPTGTESILLVEDDDLVRDFVEVMLRGLGYRVIAHGTSEGALAELSGGFKPDLLLSDVALNGPMTGPEMAEKILQQRPDLRVLFMSGYTENALSHHGRIDPGTQLITKPFRRHDLAIKIRAVLKAQPDEE